MSDRYVERRERIEALKLCNDPFNHSTLGRIASWIGTRGWLIDSFAKSGGVMTIHAIRNNTRVELSFAGSCFLVDGRDSLRVEKASDFMEKWELED